MHIARFLREKLVVSFFSQLKVKCFWQGSEATRVVDKAACIILGGRRLVNVFDADVGLRWQKPFFVKELRKRIFNEVSRITLVDLAFMNIEPLVL